MKRSIFLLALPFAIPALAAVDAAAQQGAAPAVTSAASYRVIRGGALCPFGYHSVGARYTVVGSAEGGGVPHLVLEERTMLDRCENREGPDSSRVTVVARPAAQPGAAPVWTIRADAEEGGVYDDDSGGVMYRATRYGCCDSENLDTYYSLADGRRRFTSSKPLLHLDAQPFGTGWVALHEDRAALTAPELEHDRTALAVVQMGGVRGAVQRAVIHAPAGDFRVVRWRLLARGPGGATKTGTSLGINDELTAAWTVAAVIELEQAAATVRRLTLDIPIRGGRMQIAEARLPTGFRITPAQ